MSENNAPQARPIPRWIQELTDDQLRYELAEHLIESDGVAEAAQEGGGAVDMIALDVAESYMAQPRPWAEEQLVSMMGEGAYL
jgi:hypothetical protein